MTKFFKARKRQLLILSIVVASIIPIASASNNYFEISKNLEIFSDIYKELNLHYVDELDANRLMRTGLDAMLQSLDPYTSYISEAEMEGYRRQTTGRYGGIGAIIRKKGDYVVIVEPYENSPAFKAGLQAGDKVLEINGRSAKYRNVEEVSNILIGQPGTEVTVLIRRPDVFDSREFTITRENITVENVSYYGVINGNIGFIRLEQFTENAGRNVERALKDLEKDHKLEGVILDLRGNPGGLLTEAVNVSNVFINRNNLVVSTKGKTMNQEYRTLNQPVTTELPLAVLINNTSASASEIVAGVIQDYDRGIVIGQRTFGKGLVQQTRNISYRTKLKLTTAKFYMPSGRSIQAIDYSLHNGIGEEIPDSLKSPFTTKNGRVVYEALGIEPDIFIPSRQYSNISRSLLSNDLIFDYANYFKVRNPSISSAKEFKLSNQQYEDFVAFLRDKEYEYITRSEEVLESLQANAKREKYYDAISQELQKLKDRIVLEKENDIYTFKDEISGLLEAEIASRYYSQRGRIEASFSNDPVILEAVNKLKNRDLYFKKLSGTN